jgi:thioredoxin-related protein
MAANAMEAARQLGAENNYETALAKAKEEQKILVMVVVKEHCRWCDKIINRTLSDTAVKEKLNEGYVTLIVDKDASFPNDFRENFYPSIFYIDPMTQKSVYENVGYIGTKCFINDLNSALETRKALYGKE